MVVRVQGVILMEGVGRMFMILVNDWCEVWLLVVVVWVGTGCF